MTKIVKTYKRELIVKPHQIHVLDRYAECCRFVWNRLRWIQLERLKEGEEIIKRNEGKKKGERECVYYTAFTLEKMITKMKKDHDFLAFAPKTSLDLIAKDLALAFESYKKGIGGKPDYKRKGTVNSIPFRQGTSIDNGNFTVKLLKIGKLRFRKDRQDIEGIPKAARVCWDKDGKYFMSVNCDIEVEEPIHPQLGEEVGIDLGVRRAVTLSNNIILESVKKFQDEFEEMKDLEDRITYLKSRTDRRKLGPIKNKRKGSNNWKKETEKIGKLYSKLQRKRDYLRHLISAELTDRYSHLYLEALEVDRMTKSAKGTEENPGKNVQQKADLNKSMLRVGWGEMIRQLNYKSKWKGGGLFVVDPAYTSQMCSECGHVEKGNRKEDKFKCLSCGFSTDADLNAAINIYHRGKEEGITLEDWTKERVSKKKAKAKKKKEEFFLAKKEAK
jgi:putative transposase